MRQETHTINHPRFGNYTQTVYETTEAAGHKPLASEGRYGWGMPTDPATEAFIESTTNQVVLEIGSGLGTNVVLPSLEAGAQIVHATDIVEGDLADNSVMVREAIALQALNRLMRTVLSPQWWNQELQLQPTVHNVLVTQGRSELPEDNTVDRMIARHSLQFGSPETFLRFLDLASTALKPGGTVTGINFTPYTNYMFQFDQGITMARIMSLNEEYAQGKSHYPGSFIHSERGPIKTSLAQLMKRQELDRGQENTFLYFDSPTLTGLMRDWASTRNARSLPVDLEVIEDEYFTPPSIAKINKLTAIENLLNRENHLFILRKK